MEYGAPSHNAWQQEELLKTPHLTVLPWPANPPDLNQIEPCWYHLKRKVSKRPYSPRAKEDTMEAWDDEWKNLDMEKVGKWCGRLCARMECVKD